jgi:hypothetical protein
MGKYSIREKRARQKDKKKDKKKDQPRAIALNGKQGLT